MPRLLSDLSESLNAFYQDMEAEMEHITIVTMSDFGRRAAETVRAVPIMFKDIFEREFR